MEINGIEESIKESLDKVYNESSLLKEVLVLLKTIETDDPQNMTIIYHIEELVRRATE